jgi:hypothetical protein
MMLVTCNAQGELSALERGMHALRVTEKGKLGKSISAYAEAVGRPQQSVQREVEAAEVYREVTTYVVTSPTDRPRHLAEVYRAVRPYGLTAPTDQPRHLAEIHAAPRRCRGVPRSYRKCGNCSDRSATP